MNRSDHPHFNPGSPWGDVRLPDPGRAGLVALGTLLAALPRRRDVARIEAGEVSPAIAA